MIEKIKFVNDYKKFTLGSKKFRCAFSRPCYAFAIKTGYVVAYKAEPDITSMML